MTSKFNDKFGTEFMSVSVTELMDMGFTQKVIKDKTSNKYRVFYVYKCSVPNTEIRFEPDVYDKQFAWYLVTTIGDNRNEIHLNFSSQHFQFPSMSYLKEFMRCIGMLPKEN